MKHTNRQRVLIYIDQHTKHIVKSPNCPEIAHGLQIKRQLANYYVNWLVKKGLLEKLPHNNYGLTKEGKKCLKNKIIS